MELPKSGTIEIVPSILSADFARLADELAEVEAAGVKMVHLDVMDGHFVPNITIGPPIVAKLRNYSSLFFDSHLMITDPGKYAEAFVDAGVNNITFHIETTNKPERLIERLHKLGVSAGVTLNPDTSVERIESVIGLCDMILVMTVQPGFGGQKFMDSAARKCIGIRKIGGAGIRVEVDGGIDAETAPVVISYGADTLVAGNSVFGQGDRRKAVEAIRRSFA
ncbi:MAG: ribulose-phosphate 3-epimerase [Planctomycetota bacterium]